MRIVYRDISQEFRQLLQTCMNQRDKVASINVTRAEMQALLTHAEAKQFLGDYLGPRAAKHQELLKTQQRLKQELEHITTQVGRQEHWDKMSQNEEELHAFISEVPRELTQSGIRVVVTVKG